MRRCFILLIVSVLCTVSYAQSYVSGSIGVQYETESEQLKLSVSPEVGWFLNDKNAVGIEVNYKYEKDKERHAVALQPYFRHYFITGNIGFFVDTTAGVTYTKPKEGDDAWGIKAGFVPGVDFQLSEKFSFIAKLGFIGYYQPDETKKYIRLDIDASNLKFGCIYKF